MRSPGAVTQNHLNRLMTRLPHDAPLRFTSSSCTCHEARAQRMARKGFRGQPGGLRIFLHHERHCVARQPRLENLPTFTNRSEYCPFTEVDGIQPVLNGLYGAGFRVGSVRNGYRSAGLPDPFSNVVS